MASLSIRALDGSYLNVGTGSVQGRVDGLTNLTPGTLRINRAGRRLEWAARTFGVTFLHTANGIDLGPTDRPTGSIWTYPARGALYFALDGRQYLVQARPYTLVSGGQAVSLSDGNILGGSQAAEGFHVNGEYYVVPAGKVLRMTYLYVGMISYSYAGSPSYSWYLAGTGIGRNDTNVYRAYGTVDAPLATFTGGNMPNVQFAFNNMTTNGLEIRFEGYLVDA